LCAVNVYTIRGEMETVNVDVGWDAETVYVVGVKKDVMDLWVCKYPSGGAFGAPSAFNNAIEACVGYFWEEV
jgi:hypothetical protein